jgi:hypothetical protein
MMSFLDLSPDEVISGNFKGGPSEKDLRSDPSNETLTGSESRRGHEIGTSSIRPVFEMKSNRANVARQSARVNEIHDDEDILSEEKAVPVSETQIVSDPLPVREPIGRL